VYVLRRFAAFPLEPGKLTIGAPTVTVDSGGSVFDLLGSPPERLVRTGTPVTVNARALPGTRPQRVVVGKDQVSVELDRQRVATGVAGRLRATVQGTGNLRDVQLQVPVIDGLRTLDPQVQDQMEAPQDVVGGTRTFEWIMIPERPGTYRIPPLI